VVYNGEKITGKDIPAVDLYGNINKKADLNQIGFFVSLIKSIKSIIFLFLKTYLLKIV
jgi:hypothetical protein